MNKKLLFGIMSLAALAACSDNDFQSQQVAAVEGSSVQFEVLNNNDAFTRASMDGSSIVWSAADGDRFTLYHGGADLTGYQNATYTAVAEDGAATLSTPSMIQQGTALMVWPVDTAFVNDGTAKVAISIPKELDEYDADKTPTGGIANNIPYVSDLITISAYDATTGADNTAGYNRKYPVYMRPMASQLTLKADYAGTDAVINALATGDDPIDAIALTSVDILDPTSSLTQKIGLKFAAPTAPQGTNWATGTAWTQVTDFDLTNVTSVNQLTTKCINGTESAKFLILPQGAIGATGLTGASVVVNTTYGKVEIGGTTTSYTAAELGDAWYRYMAPGATVTYGETETTTVGTGSDASKVRYTQDVEKGLAQVIDAFSTNTTSKATSLVVGEPTGAAGTRYVKVLLSHLDMDGLHIKTDKQLYDAVRVWKEIGTGNVTVNLDGDDNQEFTISQKTIAKINEINADEDVVADGRKFTVTACNVTGEVCSTIVITEGGEVPANLDFILNTTGSADVAFNEGETWSWVGTVTVDATATGITSFINRGTMNNGETATLAIYDNAATPVQVTTIPFENAQGAEWNITAGDLNVQFDVTNLGTVNISKGAEYHQDGTGNDFTNEAETLEERFFMNDPSKTAAQKAAFEEKIGKVNNEGVFATVNGGNINNYGLIEHADKDAKTYITSNLYTGTTFADPFDATVGSEKKIGRINLPYSNKDEDNVSINNNAATGFVSVTVSTGNGAPSDKKLDLSSVGTYVNYCIVESGVEEIKKVSTAIKYVEFNSGTTEIAWTVTSATYDGLIVLSPVNIKYGTTVTVTSATYLAAKMYVGGGFTNGTALYNGYYGNTTANEATMYITY